ncbi:MAG: holin [Actinoplanes sp.]
MWTRNFWRQTAERAGKTAAQAVLGLWTLDGFNVLTTNWLLMLGAALGGAGLSVLTSIVTSPVGEPNDPSAIKQTV